MRMILMKSKFYSKVYFSNSLFLCLSILLCSSNLGYSQNSNLEDQAISSNRDEESNDHLKGDRENNLTSKYRLGPNDLVFITVLRHPEVGGRYVLNSEGKIQFEFLGDIQLSGLTKEQAADFISQQLQKYVIKPEITVKILEYNSKIVYIIGEVGLPGKIFMRGDTITVREALLAAGLPQITAATKDAYFFTPSSNGRVSRKRVNVYNLLYKGDLRENYVMKPGDSLYLPPTLWAKIARVLNPITEPVSQTAGAALAVGAL